MCAGQCAGCRQPLPQRDYPHVLQHQRAHLHVLRQHAHLQHGLLRRGYDHHLRQS
ncbi:hypothetical protein D3C76_1801710 [compost metagenome]